MNFPTLVLGIGNTLLSDEGAGVRALEYLQPRLAASDSVTFLDGGTLSFTLAADIESTAQLIVIDAAQLKQPAGTVCCFRDAAMDDFVGRGHLSVHEVGLADLLDIARLAGHLPPRRALIAIQPQTTQWGLKVSAPVADGFETVYTHVVTLLRDWQRPGRQENAA